MSLCARMAFASSRLYSDTWVSLTHSSPPLTAHSDYHCLNVKDTVMSLSDCRYQRVTLSRPSFPSLSLQPTGRSSLPSAAVQMD